MSIKIQEYQPQSMWDLYRTLLNPLSEVFARAEQRGIRVDLEKTRDMEKKLTKKLLDLEREFYSKYGYYNYNSPHDCINLLINKLGCEVLRKTEKGAISINKEVLEKYENLGVEAAGDIRNLKRLKKIISTYLQNYILKNADSDGIIHFNYNLTGTVTGRLSSSSSKDDDTALNLQNITRDIILKDGTKISIRSLFIPRKGYKFVHRDAAQSEIRMLAWYSADPFLINACENDKDLHSFIAGSMFNINPEEVERGYKAGEYKYKEMRSGAKNTGFAFIYGAKDKKIYDMNGGKIKSEDIPKIRENYFKNMPNVLLWKKRVHQLAVEHENEFYTVYGRRRVLPDLRSEEYMEKLEIRKKYDKQAYREFEECSAALREGINFDIQSTSVDFTNYGIVEVDQHPDIDHTKVFTLLQTHDSVDDEVEEGYVNEYESVAKEIYLKPKGAVNIKMRYDSEVVECLQ